MSQRFSILTILLLSGGLPLTAAGQVVRGSQGLSGKEKKVAAEEEVTQAPTYITPAVGEMYTAPQQMIQEAELLESSLAF